MQKLCVAVLLFGALSCALPSPGAPPASARRPNIVFILADDMGYGDVRALNARSRIPTPNLDGLAAAGCAFVDAHTPSSVCTPTRYGLLTGRCNWRSRLARSVLWGDSEHLIPDARRTLADVMGDAGYHTAMLGKWHLGYPPSNATAELRDLPTSEEEAEARSVSKTSLALWGQQGASSVPYAHHPHHRGGSRARSPSASASFRSPSRGPSLYPPGSAAAAAAMGETIDTFAQEDPRHPAFLTRIEMTRGAPLDNSDRNHILNNFSEL